MGEASENRFASAHPARKGLVLSATLPVVLDIAVKEPSTVTRTASRVGETTGCSVGFPSTDAALDMAGVLGIHSTIVVCFDAAKGIMAVASARNGGWLCIQNAKKYVKKKE